MGSLPVCICTSVAGGREDLEWARLLSAVAVYQEIPRRLNGGQAFPPGTRGASGFGTKPVLDVGLGMNVRGKLGGVGGRRSAELGIHAACVHEYLGKCVFKVQYTRPGVLERDDGQVRST